MQVEQKEFETWCNEHCKLMHANWELYCTASYAYITGYKKFRESLIADLRKKYDPHTMDYSMSIEGIIELLEKHGETKHTVDIKDHQLGSKSTGLPQDD